jgi:phage protein D
LKKRERETGTEPMQTPAYKLTLGRKVVDTTDEPQASTAVELLVSLDLETPADGFTLVLGNVGTFRPEREDEAVIELGYREDDELVKVMTGTVSTVQPNLTTTRVVGTSGAAPLLRTFVEQTFEGKTAGAIVRELAQAAEVEVATAEDGIRFPAYVVDGRASAFHHMLDLAALAGFDLYLDADGKLVFERFLAGKKVHVYEYAKHVVELDVLRTAPRAGRVEAWGESPTDRRGEESWGWLTPDFSGSRGAAGEEGALLLVERPALRTREAARAAARAAHTEIQRRRLRGRLVGTGRPAVKLGDAIRLRGVPDESLNANFQVRSVTHRITKAGGFTTTIGFRAIES